MTITKDKLLTEAELRNMTDDDYMNDRQLAFFDHLLREMREEVMERERESKAELSNAEHVADPNDRATLEEEHWLDLRLREREALLLRKVNQAIERIGSGEYGWCEETGEAIGIPRLLVRPTATVCADVKNILEEREMQYRDRRA